jgi:voltage-gated potassium channel
MEYLTKRRTFEVLEAAQEGDTASKVVDIVITVLIGLNVAAVIAESVDSFKEQYGLYLTALESFSVVIFTVEYFLRLWCCTEDKRYSHPVKGRLRYVLSGMAIIDLLAILPFYLMYLPVFFANGAGDTRILRVVRMMRMFRLLKLTRYFASLQMILRVVNRAREELFIAFVFIITVVTIISTVMFWVEEEAQREAGRNEFSSIPQSMYWGAVTVSTVGYGDVVPITPLGRFLGAIIAILGIGMFAMPTAILSHEFMKEVQGRRKTDSFCPHCGERIEVLNTRRTDGNPDA